MKNKLQIVIEYGLYLLLFTLPWQTRWIIKEGEINGGYFEYGTYSLYASDILLLILLFLSSIYLFKNRSKLKDFKITKFWYALAFLDLFVLISIFVASNHYLAFYKYLYFLLGIGLFSLIVYFPYNKSKALFSFFSALLIQALFAIVQFLTQVSPANKWLGMAKHDPIDLGVSVVEGMGSLGFVERWLRSHGSLDHPNILGGFLAMGLFMVISTLINRSSNASLREGDDYRRRIFKMNVVFYPLIILIIVGAFFSFSRAAWLAISVSLLLFMFIAVLKRDKLIQKYFLPVILYGGIVIFLISIPFGNLIEARFKGQGRLEYISKVERIKSVSLAKDVLKDNWLFGTGIGNYTLSVHDDYVSDQESYYYQPTHNTFLLVWSEIGVFGLISLLLFLIFIFFKSLSKNILIYKIPWLFAFIILLFFDHWWWSLHFGIIYFWLICGFALLIFELDNEGENMV